jgi:hypothetical protein
VAGFRGCSRAGSHLPLLLHQSGCLGQNCRGGIATRGRLGEAEKDAGSEFALTQPSTNSNALSQAFFFITFLNFSLTACSKLYELFSLFVVSKPIIVPLDKSDLLTLGFTARGFLFWVPKKL